MKKGDINILASNHEGLSLSALESIAAGKPFIASNVQGLDLVVKNKKLLFDNSPEDIASLVMKLKNDDKWYKRASATSLKRAKDFDFQKITRKYMQVYKEVLHDF